MLVGVFLGPEPPSPQAPPILDFNTIGTNFTILSPELQQTFFIGDGFTSGGTEQTFIVPAGATRLFLGIADAQGFTGNPGFYNDNTGAFEATVSICQSTKVCDCPIDGCLKGCISGLVEDADTGQPLAGKLVRLKRISPKGAGMTLMNVVTNTGGCYSFSNLDDGTYRITVKGCKGGAKKVVVISGGSKEEGKNFQCE